MRMNVLVVDDCAPFRTTICDLIGQFPGFQVIGEAADGLAATTMAEELRPDLILLDIEMPWMNGIEAARILASVSPQSKIIFVAQDKSSQMVRLAFEIGARGYILKSHLAKQLLPALKAVTTGRTYISSQLAIREPGRE